MPTLPPGQLGVIPDDVRALHSQVNAPASARDIDLDGDEYGALAASPLGSSIRSFRGGGYSGNAPTDSRSSMGGDPDTLAAAHQTRGVPNPRQQGIPGHGYVMAEDPAIPVQYENRLALQLQPVEAPPSRPKMGWTGDDPARAATYRRPVVMRPFDQIAAQHPADLSKIPQPNPTARTSWRLGDVADPRPFAGGGTGTQAAGVGPTPNSYRIMPRAWDDLLVNVGGPAVSPSNPDPARTAAASQRARSFRL